MTGISWSLPLLIAGVVVAGCGTPTASQASSSRASGSATTPSPTDSSTPLPAASAATSAPTAAAGASTSSGPLPAGFSCGDFDARGDGGAPVQARVTAVLTGSHDSLGYERFVMRFDGSPSSVQVERRPSAVFTRDGSGAPVTLEGAAGVLVTVGGVNVASYTGPQDLHPRYVELREAEQVGAFEGQVQWALGLSHPACLRVSDPSTSHVLVVDVTTATATG